MRDEIAKIIVQSGQGQNEYTKANAILAIVLKRLQEKEIGKMVSIDNECMIPDSYQFVPIQKEDLE